MTEEEKVLHNRATTRLRFMIYYLFNSRIPGGFAVCDTGPVKYFVWDYRVNQRIAFADETQGSYANER